MGGTSIGSMEVKLKDYLDGATVLFDAAGNVVDGRLAGEGHGSHLAREREHG